MPGSYLIMYTFDNGDYTNSGTGGFTNAGAKAGNAAFSTRNPFQGQNINLTDADAYVSAGGTPSLSVSTGFTLAIWFRNLKRSSYRTAFRGHNDHFILVDIYPSQKIGFYSNSNGFHFAQFGSASASSIANDNKWHQFVVVGTSNSSHSLYVDGVLAGTISNTFNANTLVAIGNWQGGGQALADQIDEFILFQRPLTAAQVLSLYNSYNSTVCSCTGA